MRISPLKHTVAVLRQILDLRQYELAELVGRKTRTIQAVELMQLPLSEGLAERVSLATWVSPQWLLNNDVNSAPWIRGTSGTPFTKQHFENLRYCLARKSEPTLKKVLGSESVDKPAFVGLDIKEYKWVTSLPEVLSQIILSLRGAAQNNKDEYAFRKIANFAREICDEYGRGGEDSRRHFFDRVVAQLVNPEQVNKWIGPPEDARGKPRQSTADAGSVSESISPAIKPKQKKRERNEAKLGGFVGALSGVTGVRLPAHSVQATLPKAPRKASAPRLRKQKKHLSARSK